MILLFGSIGIMLCVSVTFIFYPQFFTNHMYHYLFEDGDED